ncbi:ankyrin repeat domain-containing protein [Nakamurella sp.]|uniref:ankyrin repeat domain-containing protein n=1 Tax=Nakamurella sp. TaxID=1869182 RepID=UPI003B3A4607
MSPTMPTPARWTLPDRPDLDWLRGRAKQLRRAAAAGEPEAVALVDAHDPGTGPVTLARAQLVLARAHGFAGWPRLVEHVATRTALTRAMRPQPNPADSDVDRFLRLACLSYTEPPVAAPARALLDADPTLATRSAATMAACGEAAELAERVAADPAAVHREDGPHRWPPLLYLSYARLDRGDPVATLRVLLAAGADPNSGFLWHGLPSPFTALTGVLGGGERDEPPHPDAATLAELLLAAGADPNDNQAFYNRQFRPDDAHLPPLLRHGAGRPHPSPWRDRLGDAYPSPEEMVGEHLRSAARHGFDRRVRILLEHGVDPNTRGYHPVLGDLTAYEVAVRFGHAAVAARLAAAGGRSDRIDDADRLVAAARAGDAATVAALRDRAGDLPRHRPQALRIAAESPDIAALGRLLDLGYPVDAAGPDRVTALHEAALRGDAAMCEWLLARGADRTIRDRRFDAVPAGWAAHAGHQDLAAALDPA